MPHSQSGSGSGMPRWVVPALVIGAVSAASLAVGLGVVGPMIQRRMETPPPTLSATSAARMAPLRPSPPSGDVEITERVIPRPKPKPAAPPASTDLGTDSNPAAAPGEGSSNDSTDTLDSGLPARPAIHASVTDANLDSPSSGSPTDTSKPSEPRPSGSDRSAPSESGTAGAADSGSAEGDTTATAPPRANRGSKSRAHRLSPLKALPPLDPDGTDSAGSSSKPDTVVPPDPNTAKSGRSYRVQVGRFDNAADAERLKAELTKAGLSPQVVTARRGGALQYRVQVGTFRQKENADREMEKLRAQSYDPYVSENDQ